MKTKQTSAAIYTLKTYKIGRAMSDGYIIDYSVLCPDGLVLHFMNDGGGGPDHCTHGVQNRETVFAPEQEQALAEWCETQPELVAYHKDFAEKYGSPESKCDELQAMHRKNWKPSTDGSTSIWAEEQGAALEFQRTIKRTAKRTVCWHNPGDTEGLRYYTIKRGRKLTDEDRARLAAKVRADYPDAIIHGGGE